VRVEVVRPEDLGPREADLWKHFQLSSPTTLSPFLSLTFARVVSRFRPSARVAVVHVDGDIVAFLPFEVAKGNIGRPIGWPMNDVQGFVDSGRPIDARNVVKRAGLRAWTFDAVPVAQTSLRPFYFRSPPFKARFAEFPLGFDRYIDGLSKSIPTEHARRVRGLEREFGPVAFEWNSTRSTNYECLVSWKSDQYRRTGVTGDYDVFSNTSNVQIVRDLVTSSRDDCKGIVSVVSAGERPISVQCGMVSNGILSAWFQAFDPQMSRYSPGTMMWFGLASSAANNGVTRIDFGGGDEAYKISLATGSYDLVRGRVWGSLVENELRKIARDIVYDGNGHPRVKVPHR